MINYCHVAIHSELYSNMVDKSLVEKPAPPPVIRNLGILNWAGKFKHIIYYVYIIHIHFAEPLKQNQLHYILHILFNIHFAAGVVHIPYTYHLRRSFSVTAYIQVQDWSKDGTILAYQGVIDIVLVSVESSKLVIQLKNNSKYIACIKMSILQMAPLCNT